MTGRVRTFFDLVRLPNLFTAGADILAGFLYAGGLLGDWTSWLPLVIASVLLYAGGVTLNDVCDAKRDALERPRRPIPSGRVTRRNAGVISAVFLAVGVAIAFSVSPRSGAIAVALVVAMGLYDWTLKQTPVAPVIMGICRGLNLSLGMSTAANLLVGAMLVPVGLFAFYVGSLTLFARKEATVDNSHRTRLLMGTGGCVFAFCLLLALPYFLAGVTAGARIVTLFGVLMVLIVGLKAAWNPAPDSVQRAVKTLIVLLVWFDVCVAWSGAGWAAGVIVASLIVPTLLLGRVFRVT